MSIIGIDLGSSTTKMINMNEEGQILNKLMLNRTNAKKAIDFFIDDKKIDKQKISKIVLTGVRKNEIEENIYNIDTIKVDEFIAIGTGGLYLSNKKEGLVVSIGTGTAFVKAENKNFEHIGGTGIGGGTLLNLCKKIGDISSFNEINESILKGKLDNIDLTIQDVSMQEIKTLPKDTTSANFGKLNEKATRDDIIKGIANMIIETIGMMAVFATQKEEKKDIIVIGNVATMPYTSTVLKKIEKLHNVKFIIPKYAEFATAIGAIKSVK